MSSESKVLSPAERRLAQRMGVASSRKPITFKEFKFRARVAATEQGRVVDEEDLDRRACEIFGRPRKARSFGMALRPTDTVAFMEHTKRRAGWITLLRAVRDQAVRDGFNWTTLIGDL